MVPIPIANGIANAELSFIKSTHNAVINALNATLTRLLPNKIVDNNLSVLFIILKFFWRQVLDCSLNKSIEFL